MNGDIRVCEMTKSRLPCAYPLVQASGCGLGVADWLQQAGADVDSGSVGMLAAEDGQGYMVGLLVYQVESDPLAGGVLCVSRLIMANLLGRQNIFQALMRQVMSVAEARGCAQVRVAVPDGDDVADLKAVLHDCGLARQSLLFCGATAAATAPHQG